MLRLVRVAQDIRLCKNTEQFEFRIQNRNILGTDSNFAKVLFWGPKFSVLGYKKRHLVIGLRFAGLGNIFFLLSLPFALFLSFVFYLYQNFVRFLMRAF